MERLKLSQAVAEKFPHIPSELGAADDAVVL